MPDTNVSDELVSKLTEIRKAADQQLDKELNEVISCVTTYRHAEEARGLINAALQLRSLDEGIRLTYLKRVLFTLDGLSSRYSVLMDIANAENFTTVSPALTELVRVAVYDILDDGILNLIRVECTEHFVSDILPTEETKFVRYYLTSNEWFGRGEIERRVLDTNAGMTSLCEVKVVGMKRMWFGEIGKFTEFLKILANEENYDTLYNKNMAGAIDKLLQPERFKEWED